MANGDIPFGGALPPEFGRELVEQAQFQRTRGIQKGTEALLQQFTQAGVSPESGVALRAGIENILGPEEAFQRRLAGDIAVRGALAGREERLGELQFGRRKELASQQFGFQKELQQMAQQAALARLREQFAGRERLLRLQDDLGGGFFSQLGSSFAGGLGSGLGTGIPVGIASAFLED